MCGFAGFLTVDTSALGRAEAVATRMAPAIAHRGPHDAAVGAKKNYSIQHVAPELIQLLKTVSER